MISDIHVSLSSFSLISYFPSSLFDFPPYTCTTMISSINRLIDTFIGFDLIWLIYYSLWALLDKATLSGFLDFMDRGCSNCGDLRIIVFTATNKEKPGSAFLRARGIDVHIHMPYCTPDAFEILASNYLNITTHKLFSEIKESILQTEVTRCWTIVGLWVCQQSSWNTSWVLGSQERKRSGGLITLSPHNFEHLISFRK